MKGTGNVLVFEQSSLLSSMQTSECSTQLLQNANQLHKDVTSTSSIKWGQKSHFSAACGYKGIAIGH